MEVENNYRDKLEVENGKFSSDALPGHLKCCIDNIIKREAFIQHDVISKPIPAGGGSYLGELYDITIKGKTNTGAKELNIFVKNIVTTSQDVSEFFSVEKAYNTERFFYSELAKIFKQLENDADVPIEERFKIVKGYDESNTHAILMDNIAKKGYKTLDRMKMIPLKFAELSIQQLAKFHSLSFVMQKKMPDYYERNIVDYESPMLHNDVWRNSCNELLDFTVKHLSKEYKIKAMALKSTLISNMRRAFIDDKGTRVMVHGDFRANNIMVKEEGGEIIDIVIVDHQTDHYANPVNDLLFFIYGCTDRQFRKQHMENLIDLYYDSMTNYLKYFDIDVKDVYPRSEFDYSINQRADFGLAIALCFYNFFYAPDENAPNIADGVTPKAELDAMIVRRIEEFFDEMEASGHWKSTQTWG